MICNPVSLASHLFNSSVAGTEHLIRSIIGFLSAVGCFFLNILQQRAIL